VKIRTFTSGETNSKRRQLGRDTIYMFRIFQVFQNDPKIDITIMKR